MCELRPRGASADFCSPRYKGLLFSKRLVAKAGEGEDIHVPLILSEEPGATHPPKNIPDGKQN